MPAPLSLDEAQARHLLGRIGFTPTLQEINAIKGQSARQAINQLLLAAKNATPTTPEPEYLRTGNLPNYREVTDFSGRQAIRDEQRRQGVEHKNWWLREMLVTKHPLHERMTLFWHGHFATSMIKVPQSRMMWRQHQILRQHGLGSFRSLLAEVVKDPAMIYYLDGQNNRKEAPNENLARELFELFSLGEGSGGGDYTEQDIKEAARALTGWSFEYDSGVFRFRFGVHDTGIKTILGKTGAWNGDDVINIILDQPQVAKFIATKLWQEFVSPIPNMTDIERITVQFRSSDYDLAVLMQDLLLTDDFWALRNRGALIKSPIDMLVGSMRLFEFNVPKTEALVLKAAQLGQHLLYPPNVKGWPGGHQWINATTLLERKRTCQQLMRANQGDTTADMVEVKKPQMPIVRRMTEGLAAIDWNAENWLVKMGAHVDREPDADVKIRLHAALLPLPATQTIPQGTVGFDYVRALTLDPVFQLK
jgi:uncharacterized protein (DUF1800 family)